jgi:hypothetical protein
MDKKLIANEIDELQRAVQDLKRDEDIDISLGKLVTVFAKSKEVELTDDIWDNLENTESNEIVKGDLDAVKAIAKRYGKTNPEILVKAIKSDEYDRPLIVKFDGGRYHLVAGNTRLCTAKAIGVTPKVFIADVTTKKEDIDESCWKGYKQVGGKKKNGKMVPNCVPTNEASSPAQQAAIAINMKKKGIEPKNESIEQIDEGENQPTNPSLWSRAKSMAKSKFDVYPSAYANGWAAKWYKSKGGGWKKKKKSKNESTEEISEDLRRWFKEKWVDVSKKIDGKHPPCGRKDADGKSYPKCRPSKKVSKETPKVASSYDKDEKKAMTQQKRRAEKKDPKVGKGNKPTMTHYDEQTMAGSSGQYSAPLFGTIKKELREEILSTGEYDVPAFGKTSKGGRKNPLKIDGPDSIYKGRAVKDKDFPKWGGPDSVFIKVKEKCKKFPYCNQGDINAIEIVNEIDGLKESIEETSKKYGIPYKEMENIVLNEINKIFI